MKEVRLGVALIAGIVTSSAVADDSPYSFGGYWSGKSVAGRTYCASTDILNLHRSDIARSTGRSIAREKVTFGWSGDMVFEFLSASVNIRLEPDGSVYTLVDDGSRDPATGTYTQTGSRIDVVLYDGDIVADWFVSGDGSMIQGSLTRRIEREPDNEIVGQTFTWTLIEGNDCVAEVGVNPL